MRGVRVLAVGNMYPPHYLGGYELMWEAGVHALRARGHEVRVLTTDFRRGDRPETDPDVHRELRWYWQRPRLPEPRLARAPGGWSATTPRCSSATWPICGPTSCRGGRWAGCRSR